MKYTGIALLLMGVVGFFFGIITYMAAGTPEPSEVRKFPISPTLPLVMSAVSIGAGIAVLRFGGRGYTDGSVIDPDASKE